MVLVAEGNKHNLYYGYSIGFIYLLLCLCTVLYKYIKTFKMIRKIDYADYPGFVLQKYIFLSSTKRPFYM